MARKKKTDSVVDEVIKEVENEEQAQNIEMPTDDEPVLKKKRGRKKATFKTEEKDSLLNQLSFIYSVINNVLGTRIEEFRTITQEENEKLALSTLRLMEEYGIKISSKYNALFGFIMTHASVYGFRVYMHIQNENLKKQYEASENIKN